MANKREQRLRRKARAALRALERRLAQVGPLESVAIAAIRYIGEIDAPNLHEPWSIDNRRRELRAIVHQYLGRAPERRAALVGPAPQQPAPVLPAAAARTAPLPARAVAHRDVKPGNVIELRRDVDLKRREHRLAAQRFGAVANDRGHRTDARPLAEAMESAARALVRAEQRLADAEAVDARRSA